MKIYWTKQFPACGELISLAFYDNAGEIELFEAFLFDSFLAKMV
jgi:hypothetical protein